MDDGQIRFLVATDVHLGHKERHPVRHSDSFEGFEEVMEYAKVKNVDFVLLGGDLFDEVNPSKQCFFRCLNILKENVFGQRRVKIKVTLNGKDYKTNFENEDISISLPIFTIHGNHDYPTNQFGKISACDLLQASNYVNYFGKQLNLHSITIKPLIITKLGSTTQIALYGLGYIKDEILRQLFQQKNFVFQPPVGDLKDYVTILVIHQNRYKKDFRPGVPVAKSFDPRNIPEWIKLTIWGHEHEAIYKLENEFERNIFQPGSTVLTSYIEAEAIKKQCALISLSNNRYKIESLLLQKSFRPMVCLNYQYQELKNKSRQDFDLFDFLNAAIPRILDELKQKSKRKPILRLKIEYTGLPDILRVRQIESRYYGSVANCDKIISFWKRREEKPKKVSDEQLFSVIKMKKIIKGGQTIAEQIGGYIKNGLDKYTMNYFKKDFLLDLASYLGEQQSLNATEVIKKRCMQFQKKTIKTGGETIMKMNAQKSSEIKKALKYHMDKKEMITTGKMPSRDLYNADRSQDFLEMESSMMDANKLKVQIRNMENKEEQGQGSKTITNQSIQAPSRQSRIKRKDVSSDNSIIQLDRSDSEDCCQRALKTPYDEYGNKLKFHEAKAKVEEDESKKYKKSALLDQILKKPKSMKEQIKKPIINVKEENKKPDSYKDPKGGKNVRFSDDFM